MYPAIIIGTVLLLWTWLWGRYHVPQNIFLVCGYFQLRDAADCRTGKRREKNKKKTSKKNAQNKQPTLRSVNYTSET